MKTASLFQIAPLPGRDRHTLTGHRCNRTLCRDEHAPGQHQQMRATTPLLELNGIGPASH